MPPKPTGDGPDYEATGYGLSQGLGWSTSHSSSEWQSIYQNSGDAKSGLDYSIQLARRGPSVAETNRPPLLPLCIATVYQVVPRGPIAFGMIRIGLACCLSMGCAIAVAWGIGLAQSINKFRDNVLQACIGVALIAIVYSERNLRNYTTDFLTEPLALLLTQAFLLVTWYGSKRGNWQWATLSGTLFAGMYFCRGVFVLWVPLVMVWLWYAYKMNSTDLAQPRLSPMKWSIGWLVAFGLVAATWWVRNCAILESFHPLGTKGMTTLMGGYCDESYDAGGEWQFEPEKRLRSKLESERRGNLESEHGLLQLELELNKQAGTQVRTWIAENDHLLPSLFWKRIVTEWNPYQGKALLLRLLAVVGIIGLARESRVALIWLLGPLAINTIVVAMTYSVGGRFLVPTYGPFYILSAFGIAYLLTMAIQIRLGRQQKSR